MRQWLVLTALLAGLALVASSCGDLQEGDITAPGFTEPQEIAFSFCAKVPSAAVHDSVFIGGSFIKSWTPVDPDAVEPFGTIASDSTIEGRYTRLVWASGEKYTVILWRRGADGRLIRITEVLTANGVPLTACSWNEYAVYWEFAVGRNSDGDVLIDPLRNDRARFVEVWAWTDGIASTHPDSLYLNDAIGPGTPIEVLSAWTGMNLAPCEWGPNNAWEQRMFFPRPGDFYVRFQRTNGDVVLAGCHIGTLRLNHVELSGWAFKIHVAEDGTITNAGPPNLPGTVTIGS